MLLHLHRPAPPLDRFVELVTFYADYFPDHRKEKLLPDGAVEIIIDLTDTPKRLYERSTGCRPVSFRHAWISGMRSRWIVIEAAPGSSMAVIRFKPGGAYRVLGFAVEAITNEVDQLDAVLGTITASLRDRILEAPDAAAKMRAIEQWLAERISGEFDTHPIVDYVSQRLFSPAGIRVRDVVDEIGYTQRHVLKLFRRWVGMTPKQYGRIRRFQQVLSQVAAGAPVADPVTNAFLRAEPAAEPDWADIAVRFGYYDQSHLIHEFRQLSGMTPTGYARSFRGLENYLPL